MGDRHIKSLNQRHQLIGYLVLAGRTTAEIAKALEMSEMGIAAVRQSPLFKAFLDDLSQELRGKSVGDLVDRIVAEGTKSIDVLVEVRDEADEWSQRRLAARDLLEFNPHLARRSVVDETRTVRIVLDGPTLERLASGIQEAERAKAALVEMTPRPNGRFVAQDAPQAPIPTLREVLDGWTDPPEPE